MFELRAWLVGSMRIKRQRPAYKSVCFAHRRYQKDTVKRIMTHRAWLSKRMIKKASNDNRSIEEVIKLAYETGKLKNK